MIPLDARISSLCLFLVDALFGFWILASDRPVEAAERRDFFVIFTGRKFSYKNLFAVEFCFIFPISKLHSNLRLTQDRPGI
jgi:hypothetical protein